MNNKGQQRNNVTVTVPVNERRTTSCSNVPQSYSVSNALRIVSIKWKSASHLSVILHKASPLYKFFLELMSLDDLLLRTICDQNHLPPSLHFKPSVYSFTNAFFDVIGHYSR